MTTTVQPVLSCDQRHDSDITVCLAAGGTSYEVYLGVALLERVGADPESVARKMLVGRLHNAGWTLKSLRETFGHDGRTVKKWAAALASGDIEQIAQAFVGRSGGRKVSPELMRYAWQQYRERDCLGRNYRAIIIGKIAEVFGVRISTTTASSLFASAPENRCAPAPASAPEPAGGLQMGPSSSLEDPVSVKESPTPLPLQTSDGPSGVQWVHHAGQALFAGEMKGISEPLQRQFIGQILQGAVNVEQSKTLCLRSLSLFTGPTVAGLKEQRDGLDRLASESEVLDAYARNAALLSDGPNRGDLFYFDPHTKEYTGQLKVLKGWCGRRHGVVKSLCLDSFHTRSGRPCFVRHYSPYYDMRERFFMSLAQFDLLFDAERRCGRTFVIDRGIYSLPVLQAFAPDYVITWEKGYSGGGWDPAAASIVFSRPRTRNNSRDLRMVVFECQESAWRRDGTFRRIVVRLRREGEDAVELSVITSHPQMDVQDVVWAICSRWLQENDFKYLDTHFGVNQLTARDSTSFRERADRFEDRPVDSPEYRDLKAEIRALEGRLAGQLLNLRREEKQARELEAARTVLEARRSSLIATLHDTVERLQNDREAAPGEETIDDDVRQFHRQRRELEKATGKNADKRARLQEQITRIEARIDPLEARLCEAVRRESKLQLLIDGDYRLLDTRRKAMMDALRVTASNIFRNVQERFRAVYDNFRDDHVIVRMLSRCSGTVAGGDGRVIFTLWLPGTLQPHRIRAVETFLQDVEMDTNAAMPGAKMVRLRCTVGPQPA